jgi:outer membrane protein W
MKIAYLAAATAAIFCAASAHASDFAASVGYQLGGGASSGSVRAEYFVTDHISGEVSIASPYSTGYKGGTGPLSGQAVGSGRLVTGALSAKFYFGDAAWRVRPFAGLGVAVYAPTSSAMVAGSVSTGIGPVFSLGANVRATEHIFFTASVAYAPRPTMGSIPGSGPTGRTTYIKDTRSDYLAYAGIGYRF